MTKLKLFIKKETFSSLFVIVQILFNLSWLFKTQIAYTF